MNSKGGDGLNDEVGSIMNFFYQVFPVQIYAGRSLFKLKPRLSIFRRLP